MSYEKVFRPELLDDESDLKERWFEAAENVPTTRNRIRRQITVEYNAKHGTTYVYDDPVAQR